MNPTLPPKCERWPAPPARDYALFAEPPGATGAGALELVVTRRVIDPRELCLTPAVTERFHAVGNALCDWVWLSAGLDEPAREPWQVWPLGFDPVVYQVWTVTQREPLNHVVFEVECDESWLPLERRGRRRCIHGVSIRMPWQASPARGRWPPRQCPTGW